MLRFIKLYLVPLTSLQASSLLVSSGNYYGHASTLKGCLTEGEVRTG